MRNTSLAHLQLPWMDSEFRGAKPHQSTMLSASMGGRSRGLTDTLGYRKGWGLGLREGSAGRAVGRRERRGGGGGEGRGGVGGWW